VRHRVAALPGATHKIIGTWDDVSSAVSFTSGARRAGQLVCWSTGCCGCGSLRERSRAILSPREGKGRFAGVQPTLAHITVFDPSLCLAAITSLIHLITASPPTRLITASLRAPPALHLRPITLLSTLTLYRLAVPLLLLCCQKLPPKTTLRLRTTTTTTAAIHFYRLLLPTLLCSLFASYSCTTALLIRPASGCYSTYYLCACISSQPSPKVQCSAAQRSPHPRSKQEDSRALTCIKAHVASTLPRQAPAHPWLLYRATYYTGCLALCFARLRSTLSAVRSRAGANPLIIAGRFLLPPFTYLPSPYPAGPARQLWCNLTSRDGHAARSPQCLAQCSLSSPDTYRPGRQS